MICNNRFSSRCPAGFVHSALGPPRTYQQAQDSCESVERSGDSWHLCARDEVEENWKEYLLKASSSAEEGQLE